MTFDLYAGGQGGRDEHGNSRSPGSATFNVIADADPNLILRVGAALNLLNVAPRNFRMEARPEGTAALEAQVDCAEAQADLVARKLQQITSVHNVVVAYVIAQSSAKRGGRFDE
jgi:hypothetical protein